MLIEKITVVAQTRIALREVQGPDYILAGTGYNEMAVLFRFLESKRKQMPPNLPFEVGQSRRDRDNLRTFLLLFLLSHKSPDINAPCRSLTASQSLHLQSDHDCVRARRTIEGLPLFPMHYPSKRTGRFSTRFFGVFAH